MAVKRKSRKAKERNENGSPEPPTRFARAKAAKTPEFAVSCQLAWSANRVPNLPEYRHRASWRQQRRLHHRP